MIQQCEVIPVTKEKASLNVVVKFHNTVQHGFYDIAIKITRRGYRSIMSGNYVDMCKYLDGTITNAALTYGLNLVRKKFPKGTLHPCPYAGTLEFKNIMLDPSEGKTKFPAASYRVMIKFHNAEDENIATITFLSIAKDQNLYQVHDVMTPHSVTIPD
ncbi:CLUMA_CG002472, isoform A [Clunio marinus]|uniref:CLUMA_CG002472, isoform A n=1 Tax=Clunio marinus TaxID=568069 RepID=A0A1J1HQ38_9DIPT|nr:CLUMA_CG002472, isoform A [Clunio marinus]